MTRENKLYEELYGDVPLEHDARMQYILGQKYDNEKLNKQIAQEIRRSKRNRWIPFTFTMLKCPVPAARPRVNTSMGYPLIYVPHASREATWFKEYLKENNLPTITTPCIIDIDVFIATPKSFSRMKKALAELRVIRPWNKSDWDNFAKTICDQIQHGMLENDSLIIDGRLAKYYSAKPRIEVRGKYMEKEPQIGGR